MRNLGAKEEIDRQIEQFISTCKNHTGTISAMLSPEYIGCSPEKNWIELEYCAASWMSNIRGVLHGGSISAIVDNAMGGVAWCLCEGKVCPTISLQVSFVRPIKPGNSVCVRARQVGGGRSIIYTAAELWEKKDPRRILASATAVYAAG